MSPKRSDEISIKLRHEAKKIYDNLPAKGKGEWVSDAIIEKAARESGESPFTPEQENRMREIIKEVMKNEPY